MISTRIRISDLERQEIGKTAFDNAPLMIRRETERQTERKRETERQKDRETERQKDTETQRRFLHW